MKKIVLSIFYAAFVLVNPIQASESSANFFQKDILEAVESIRVYKVRKGNDILMLYYTQDAIYKNMEEFERFDEKAFDSRKYYVLGSSRLESAATRTEWSFAIDDEDEIINFRPLGVECSFYKFAFHLNILIRSNINK
jgi:hypothetical protein